MTDKTALTVESVALDDLIPHPDNARQGDVGAIAESLKAHGQYKPIVVQASTGFVIAGNHTLQAARVLGWPELEVVKIDVDDDEARRIMLVDNRTTDLATYDDEGLARVLSELTNSERGLEGTGFDGDDLDDLMRSLDASMSRIMLTEPDAVPDVPGESVTRPGDLWILGAHRLLCGDSTLADSYARLMDGSFADCIWTDPPYGVEYVGKTKDALTIKNDGEQGLAALLAGAFAQWDAVAIPGAAVYVAHPAGALSLVFIERFLGAGWRLHETLVWDKQTIVLGHSDYHYSHEPILFGYLPGGGRRGRGGKGWYGDNSQKSVLSVPKPSRSETHPTMKPVELVSTCISNSCPDGGVVLDPFGGSGSTLIACEQKRRQCRMIELDPLYVDVIVKRWEDFTGQKAVLAESGH